MNFVGVRKEEADDMVRWRQISLSTLITFSTLTWAKHRDPL